MASRTTYSPPYGDGRYGDPDYLIDQQINDLIDRAIDQIVEGAIQGIADWAQKLDASKLESFINSQLPKVYEEIGDAAWRSMMSSYGQRVTRRSGPSYRQGHNRLPGELKQALGNKSRFYTVDSNGLSWGNVDALNASAAHWRRITFGAGGAGSGIHVSRDIAINGVVLGRLILDGAPSAGFAMPPGFWKGSEFYPYTHRLAAMRASGRPMEWHPTRGIQTHDIFSAAIERMAIEIPEVLARLIERALQQFDDGSGDVVVTREV